MIDSPASSPAFVPTTGKRSLPDVQEEREEPQEREEDFDMFDDSDDLYDCLCKFTILKRVESK